MESRVSTNTPPNLSKAAAVRFVVLLGVVSLFADATYEGARSIAGPYLALLGASGTVVGFVAGFGELVGYGLRLVSGYLSDRTRRYWAITLVGYTVNLLAVPFLALAGRWEIAAALLIGERVGKALRNPPRDAMLSYATKETGRGWGFGLHEALDQIGAVIGPLIVTAVIASRRGYPVAFALLAIPAVLALSTLLAARWLYPRPQDLETATPELKTAGFPRAYWTYLAAVALVAAGYADFPLIAYHFGKASTVPTTWIPLLYAVAMGVDGLAALLFGRWFDRAGIPILAAVALLSALFAPLVFSGGFALALLGMALWGLGMGAQESVLRAAIAGMVAPERRGSAYGIFNTGYGLFWFLGSAVMGMLYDVSLPALIAFSVVVQLAAAPLFLVVAKQLRKEQEVTGRAG
ncbi:MAG: MFS transporter [Armatimonadetes bacterium CG_4_10_14_3_um_filter_66_18]|nr:MFS transporter [Armatimonadota bacterium]OIP10657.1 MAG: MFS transporter [Armatimonadetes bacterium CG2_30_66_41]PIW12830.1 MAG: MFS transporter [Armatimonadetes bacterium CG17_big_fil_post_rev_8_21_14_2_50_66_6]PIX48876.1 MAG: MFS transporter [Armatimonadetes bacterium CG_4_8_14_3_um_filter_66_20]PIY44379.1 MAG: MFS transporter [Armatimonadetes bacterium CG_4_10_14_3_um_filter_66_18]PIZ47267.1 MAG: MFS transporter [Armatimonadetes bacterium CG_4_10_14_0_8_um_filter_66_14]PJB67307.1 MAG: 